jgi:hypothetical protein
VVTFKDAFWTLCVKAIIITDNPKISLKSSWNTSFLYSMIIQKRKQSPLQILSILLTYFLHRNLYLLRQGKLYFAIRGKRIFLWIVCPWHSGLNPRFILVLTLHQWPSCTTWNWCLYFLILVLTSGYFWYLG